MRAAAASPPRWRRTPRRCRPGDFIGKWISLTKDARADLEKHARSDEERYETMEKLSILRSIENLRSFPCISITEEKGRTALHGAYFDIESGDLSWYDRKSGWFRPVQVKLERPG